MSQQRSESSTATIGEPLAREIADLMMPDLAALKKALEFDTTGKDDHIDPCLCTRADSATGRSQLFLDL